MTDVSSVRETKAAIVAALTADAAFMSLVTGLFDTIAPEGQVLPYVTIGSPVETPWHSIGFRGWQVVFTLDVWSTGVGTDEAFTIVEAMNAVLDNTHLSMTGYDNLTEYAASTAVLDAETLTVHVPVRYRTLNSSKVGI